MSPHKAQRLIAALVSTLLITTLNPIAWSAKPPKAKSTAGRENGAVNTILNGRGLPKAILGVDGDFYIDVTTFMIYGPKKNGKWPTGVSLKGPQGSDGKVGEKGTSGAVGTGTKGDKGEKGDKGDKGDRGEKGERGATGASGESGPQGVAGAMGATGATGPAGPAGPAGAQGAAGPAGAEGSPGATGLQGVQGEKGDKGDKGDQGVPGQTGAKGDTGDVGPICPSGVQLINVESFTVGLSTATSYQSGNFGSLLAGKKYQFEVVLQGYVLNSLGQGKFYGLSLDSDPAGIDLKYSLSINEARVFENGLKKFIYNFVIAGTASSVSSTTSLRVSIRHTDGEQNMSVLGKAYIREVAEVS